jgi:hypothetical protein
MKKSILFGLAAAGILTMSIAGCKKVDFDEEYNVNPAPNVSSFANTSQLLSNALLNAGNDLTISAQVPAYYVQWLMQSQYPEDANYQATNVDWNAYYVGPLQDLQTIINLNSGDAAADARVTENGSTKNQLAIARIAKAWFFSIVTDRWGDVPYFDALKLNFNPKYDKQADIYTDLFKELREASAQFDGGAVVKGDILFNGDVTKWKMFANSLRMVLALRLSKAAPAQGKAEFVAAYNDAAGFVNNNSKNLSYTYLNNPNFRSSWNSDFETRDDWGVSDVFINWLVNTNDKRLTAYAQPNAAGQYKGVPYGYNRDQLITWTNSNDYSRMGTKIIGYTLTSSGRTLISYAPSPGYIFTAAQMWLTVAEANALGWVGSAADVAVSYANAVKASWDQWGVTYTPAELAAYLSGAQTGVTGLSGENLMKVLGQQKWTTLYPNGWEGWSEWRRTNYPVLTPSAAALNDSKKIPLRNAYPVNEPILNGANYRTQVATMPGGVDTHDVPVWWDK